MENIEKKDSLGFLAPSTQLVSLSRVVECLIADVMLSFQRFDTRWDSVGVEMEYDLVERMTTACQVLGISTKELKSFAVYRGLYEALRQDYVVTFDCPGGGGLLIARRKSGWEHSRRSDCGTVTSTPSSILQPA